MNNYFRLSVLAFISLGAFNAQASSIFTIYNTGENGTPTDADSNWTIVGGDATGTAFVTDGFPVGGPWIADNLPLYGWITPQPAYPGSTTDSPDTDFIFTTTFDLTGYDPTTAILEFVLASDNSVSSISLNGVTEITGPLGVYFGLSNPLTINSDFVSGLNTLSFTVHNDSSSSGNPVGLLVDFTTSTADSLTPEPASAVLLGAGLVGIGLLGRKHRKN